MVKQKNDNPIHDQNKLSVIVGNPDKNIPKLCTSMNFSVIENSNVVLTMTYNS